MRMVTGRLRAPVIVQARISCSESRKATETVLHDVGSFARVYNCQPPAGVGLGVGGGPQYSP
jgi:hypothetical protein